MQPAQGRTRMNGWMGDKTVRERKGTVEGCDKVS